jgi:hypothetical protein
LQEEQKPSFSLSQKRMKTIQTTEWDELQKKFGNFVKEEVEEDNQ